MSQALCALLHAGVADLILCSQPTSPLISTQFILLVPSNEAITGILQKVPQLGDLGSNQAMLGRLIENHGRSNELAKQHVKHSLIARRADDSHLVPCPRPSLAAVMPMTAPNTLLDVQDVSTSYATLVSDATLTFKRLARDP